MRRHRAEQRSRSPLPPRRLNVAERGVLAVEIVRCYLLARRALASAPLDRALESLRGAFRGGERGPETLSEAQRLGVAVARTLRPLPGDTRCLVRSLVLTRLLADRGIVSTLVIGTRSWPAFLAHAWVEHGGEPVLDPGEGVFQRLVEL